MSTSPAPRQSQSVLDRFLEDEAAGGILLMAVTALALILANTALSDPYYRLINVELGPTLTEKLGPMTLHLWVNDGLMAIFFLFVGLEIKREVVEGSLSTWEQRRLPMLPALFGIVLPACIYLVIVGTTPDLSNGWAIPAATDIAFALGVLSLLGRRVPFSLKLFLVTVAIVDDIVAVAIIALFYTASINGAAVAGAVAIVLAMVAMNRMGVIRLAPYLVGCVLLWYVTLLSGVHATIAGVVGALTIPIVASTATRHATNSPLHRLEHALSPWVAFLIVPVFGFTNAGVSLGGLGLAGILAPLPLGIAAGLFLGKQIGVLSGVAIAARLGLAKKPLGASWLQIYAVAMLCGVGFTMSLFIGSLAFPGQPRLVDEAKIGTLAGSLLSAILAFLILRFAPQTKDIPVEEVPLVDADQH